MKDGKEEMKMRRLTSFGTVLLSVLAMLLVFCSVVLAQDRLQEMFPGSEVSWEKRFDGEIKGFEVAKESGHVVVSSVESDGTYIYLLDKTGRQLWKKKLTSLKRGASVAVSDNGETILVGAGWKKYVYDSDGTLLCEKRADEGLGYYLSPEGNYLIPQIEDWGRAFTIYRKDGSPLWESPPSGFDKGYFLTRFVTENEALVFNTIFDSEWKISHHKLMMVKFPSLEVEWEYSINTPVWVTNFNQYSISCGSNFVIFTARGWDFDKDPTYILSFTRDGELVWKREDITFVDIIKLTPDEKHVLVYAKDFYILDNKTGETLLKHEMPDSFAYLETFLLFDRKIVLSGYYNRNILIYLVDKNWNIVKEEKIKGRLRGLYSPKEGKVILVEKVFKNGSDFLRVKKARREK